MALARLGAVLGRVICGRPLAWSFALLLGGMLLAYVGLKLEII